MDEEMEHKGIKLVAEEKVELDYEPRHSGS
jgi:hypothetical protein